MECSLKGKELIKEYEGLSLKAYRCPANKLTIGWGHTKNVKPSDEITLEQAEQFFAEDIKTAESYIKLYVKKPLTQGQHDALTSFIFNLGGGRFAKSTLLKRINEGHFEIAAKELDRWVYSGKRKMPGLVKRRAEEKTLFLTAG